MYKPKRPETSNPFFVGALTVKPQTLGKRPTEIDEISEPDSKFWNVPLTTLALPAPFMITDAAVSPPAVYWLYTPSVSIEPVEVYVWNALAAPSKDTSQPLSLISKTFELTSVAERAITAGIAAKAIFFLIFILFPSLS